MEGNVTTLDPGSSREILDTFDQIYQVNKIKEKNTNKKIKKKAVLQVWELKE